MKPTVALAWASLVLGSIAAGASCTDDAFCFDCPTPAASTSTGQGGGASCDVGGTCPDATQACCLGVCVDLTSDTEHCGDCNIACTLLPHAGGVCVESACQIECEPGYGDCNLLSGDGCEINLVANPENCGECGKVCLLANATAGCEMSECLIVSCKPGFADCNRLVDDGCEANVGSDPQNCGMCDNQCATLANAEAACVAAMCVFGGCKPGFDDCNGMLADGCEVNVLVDPLNCGTCSTTCPDVPHSEPACVGGVCGVGPCELGWDDCDASVWSGCETELATTVLHCGACNQPCPALPHGYPDCTGGVCTLGGCDPGWADCDLSDVNGCEVELATNVAHCGACNAACPLIANGMPSCAGFQCGIASCDAGYADCFGGLADGCETNTLTDPDHCGSCIIACAQVPQGQKTCTAGLCDIASCAAGYEDCNGDVSDGCETNLKTDVGHCGTCATVCPVPPNGSAACVDGACGLGGCDLGFSNCDNDPTNGCELSTLVDPNNCGGCGVKCGSGTCALGACTCNKTVLLIADDSASGTATLGTSLTAAGYTVTQTAVPSYQYNGNNPPLAGFGAVVLLAGGPSQSSYTTDMPAAGQTALLDFINVGGNGLVLTEWAAFHVAANRWQTLSPLVLLTRTAAYSGQVNYAVDGPFLAHPVWAGLPGSFTFASTSNVGITKLGTGITRIAGSAQAVDGVAIRDVPVGRVVHIAHAGNYAPNGWTNTNVQKLVASSVGWAARCQ